MNLEELKVAPLSFATKPRQALPSAASSESMTEIGERAESSQKFTEDGLLKNPSHERFAQLVAAGINQTDAYQVVFNPDKRETAHSAASRLLRENKFPEVVERVRSLQRRSAEAEVMTLIEKRQFLRQVVMTPIAQVDANSILCHTNEITTHVKDGLVTTNEKTKTFDKLKAIEIDAKLAGELAPEDDGKNATIPANMEVIINLVTQFVSGAHQAPMKTIEAGVIT